VKQDRDNILSFDQGAGFYLRTGRRQAEAGNLIRALSHLRMAYEKDPDNGEITIALAEILNRMQRFEESIAVLMSMGRLETLPPDGIFGMASNFIAMEEFGPARMCLECYLHSDPNGAYAADAADYLELMNDTPEMNWQLGLDEGEDMDLIAHIHYAKTLHVSGRDREALRHLQDLEERYPKSLWLQMEIALSEYCIEEYEACEQRLFNILKEDRSYVRAKCLLALLRRGEGKKREAQEMLRSVSIPVDGTTEELGNLNVMLLEVGDYGRAEECGECLYKLLPYDPLTLHELGYAKYMLGKADEAADLYRRIVEMDAHDTVAAWYLAAAQAEPDPQKGGKGWTIQYDVPYRVAVERLRKMGKAFEKGPEFLKKRWTEDPAFRDTVAWALCSPLAPDKHGIITILAVVADQEAQRMLREYLLRSDQPDEDKQLAFGALHTYDGAEPHAMFYNGLWQFGEVIHATLPANLPQAYLKVFQRLARCAEQIACPERTVELAQRAFYYFVLAQKGVYRRISPTQEDAFTAAFVCMAIRFLEQQISEEALCEAYDITVRRLNNALKIIFTTLEAGSRE
jgi:tetratricopeptide (TPR) repeat protein